MPLDLLVPDLLLPRDAPAAMRALRLPQLEKWLARADVEPAAGIGASRWLGAAFDLASPPVAAIALAGEGAPRDGAWMRADPVHLRIDRDHLKLHDASILDVRRDEADAMVASLQEHFGQDGFEFHVAAPERWYVRVPEGALPRKTTSVEDALGRDVFGLLPENRAGGPINWRGALTEAQMVLGAHEVNARREAQGKPAINSVWFWGEGSAPAEVAKRYALIHAEDAFARGLGALSRAEVRPGAKSIADIDLVREGDAVLAVLGDLTAALHRVDDARWKAAAEALDARWFAGLGEAIERFERVRLVLPAEKDTRVATLTAAARWRWFRARKPLAAHA